MVPLRFIGVFCLLGLLTGCGGEICPAPHEPRFQNHTPCWYSIKVNKVDTLAGDDTKVLVTGTIPDNVGEGGVDHKKEYSFYVNAPKHQSLQIRTGSEEPYLFIGSEFTPYLELYVFPEFQGSTKK